MRAEVTDGQTGRGADRRSDKVRSTVTQTDWWTDGRTDRKADRQTEKETDRRSDRQTIRRRKEILVRYIFGDFLSAQRCGYKMRAQGRVRPGELANAC